MTNSDETHRILGQIETRLGQIESSVKNLQHDVSEIAGGLAVVLNRTDENREKIRSFNNDIEAVFAELEASKKKVPTYNGKSRNLSNISLLDLQRTRAALQRWKAQHPSQQT